jgi:hypothetical protein
MNAVPLQNHDVSSSSFLAPLVYITVEFFNRNAINCMLQKDFHM